MRKKSNNQRKMKSDFKGNGGKNCWRKKILIVFQDSDLHKAKAFATL